MEQQVNDSIFIELDKPEIQPEPKKRKLKLWVKLILALLVVAAGILIYLSSDASNIKSIKVINNTFVSDSYIKEISGLTLDDKFILYFLKNPENKMKKNPLIDDVKVYQESGNSIVIDVKENLIVGYEINDNSSNLILTSGEKVKFDAKIINNLALLPLFSAVRDDQIVPIANALGNVNMDILMRISEVHNVAFTYDFNMVKLVMDNGYYIFSSVYGLRYIDNYIDIIATNKDAKTKCILIIEEYEKAALMSCKEIDTYRAGYSNDAEQPSNGDKN